MEGTVSVLGGVFRDQIPIDLTGYKKSVRTQDFPQSEYDIKSTSKVVEITIPKANAYLSELEFWAYITKRTSAGAYLQTTGVERSILWEVGNLMDSIEIMVDGQRVCYIQDARYLLSIINQ